MLIAYQKIVSWALHKMDSITPEFGLAIQSDIVPDNPKPPLRDPAL